MRAALQLGLLGPFEVRLDGGAPLALGGMRQRALLAILGLHRGQVVSTDQLVDQLWGEQPPPTAVHTVQVFVSRLRSGLGPAGERLITRPPGYVLEVEREDVDAEHCEELYSRARAALAAGRAGEAAALLRDATGLWRGTPLADFTYEPFAQATIARLEELRVSCREELIEAELALGHHAAAVSELEALVREHPFRERPRGQLMLALYRCGRQADALEAYQAARRALLDELGVEPSDALRELEEAILRQDESLRLPAAEPEPTEPPGDEPAEAPPQHEMLRKTATVLVARIEPSADADPERARALIRGAREDAETIISRHGGTFVGGLGGELVGVFGIPSTREDDVVRALRSACELAAIPGGDDDELIARIGVDTGEVVAEDPGDLFGEPLTRGIALARDAEPAEVLLSEHTRRLAPSAVRVEPGDRQDRWRLVEVVEDSEARERQPAPMVGRESELNAARCALENAIARQELHLFTVVGEAGVGKTRLAHELIQLAQGEAVVLQGRCLSYGDGVGFWPLREAVTAMAGGGSPEAIRGLLDSEDDAELVAQVVAGAIGGGSSEATGEQIPWAFRRLFEALARRRPVLLVIEDAHWAEPPFVNLIDYLLDWLTAPVTVICLARPELLESYPTWGGGRRGVDSVVLVPLGEDEALRLLEGRLGDRALSEPQRARILAKAEGNPLFLEQLLALSAEDPWWSQDSEIPASLQTLLAARLDRLGPGERAVIERAAVIGRGFWPSAVSELLPTEARPAVAEHLRALIRRGLIHPDRSTLAGEDELRFHHILIRDVAYRSTPKSLRAQLHEQFADWLAARPEASEEFVGYHLDQSVAYRRELRRSDAELVALAVRGGEQLAVAGRRALARGDANAGARSLRRSAELFELSRAQHPDVLLDLGVALSEIGELHEAERALETAREQAERTNLEGLEARISIELSDRRALADPDTRVGEMLAVAEGAKAVFTRLRDEAGLSRAWQHVAEVDWIRCRCAEMEQVLERALEHADRAGEALDQSRILTALAAATVFGPQPVGDGIRRCTAILERAHDDVRLRAVTETMLAVLEAMHGDFDQARERCALAKRRLQDVGLGVTVAGLEMYRAVIELMAGCPENVEPDVRAAYELLELTGNRSTLPTTAALLARLLYAEGRYDEADHYCTISQASASAEDVGSQVLWRGTRGKILAQAGDARTAEELADSAVAMAEQGDLLMIHGDALVDRAEALLLLDRPEEAMRDLDEAQGLYERKGMHVSVEAIGRRREALAESGGRLGQDVELER